MKDADKADILDKEMEQKDQEGQEGTEYVKDDSSKLEKKGLA